MARIKSKMRAVESSIASGNPLCAQRRSELREHDGDGARVQIGGERFQLFRHHSELGQLRSNVPGLLDIMGVQPTHNLVFAAGLLRFSRLAQPLILGANLVFPIPDLFRLGRAQAEPS